MSNGRFIEKLQALRASGAISVEASVEVMLSGMEQIYEMFENRIPAKLPAEHEELMKFKEDWEGRLKVIYGVALMGGTLLFGGLGSLIFLVVTHQIDIIWIPRP